MDEINSKIMTKIDAILSRCEKIINDADNISNSGKPAAEKIPLLQPLIASIQNIYRTCFPSGVPDHLKIGNFQNTLMNIGVQIQFLNELGIFNRYLGYFKGFVDDLKSGLILRDLSKVISLNLYNDLLKQAEDLRKYNIESLNRASCVLGRIVLEDTLNQICITHQITLTSDSASFANDQLKNQSIIPQVQWRQNQVWLDIGNKAAHPPTSSSNFNTVTEAQMDEMSTGIKKFSEDYL